MIGYNRVFVNHSLSRCYRVLCSKVLLNMGKMNRPMVSNATVGDEHRISKYRAPISITHADDFTKLLPDI